MAEDVTLSVTFGNRTYSDPAAGAQAFIKQLRRAWAGEAQVASRELLVYLQSVAQALAARHGQAWPGGTSDSSLSRRSGKSVQSIIRSVKVTGTTWDRLRGSIGGDKTLAIHEYGGTVKSRGKMLTIPLPAALSTRGVPPPFARQWKNTFVAWSRKGNLLIFQRRGAEIVPLYVLVDSYVIAPRLGMRKELETQLPYFLNKAADAIARDVMRQLGG